MAYKFQIGAARLSGSIIQSDGTGDLRATTVDSLVSEATIAATGLASLDGGINTNDDFTVDVDGNLVAVAGTYSGLASLDGGINVNDTLTVSTAGAVAGATSIDGSGDLTMGSITMSGFTVDTDGDAVAKTLAVPDGATIGNASRADMLTLAASAVTVKNDADFNIAKTSGLQLAGAAVTSTAAELNLLDAITRGSIVIGDASGASARLAKGGANTVLKSNGTDIAYGAVVNADIANNAAIALSKLAAGGSPADMIVAGSNPGKTPTYVAMSGDATLAVAGGITLAAAQTNVASMLNAALVLGRDADNKVDFATDNVIKFNANGAEKMVINGTGVTVDGNFSVLGTTTTVNSTTINISSSFTFEGDVAGDSKTTILHSGLPVANTRVNLPTLAAGTYHLPVLFDAPTAASALVTAAEFSLLDGATSATATTVIAADRVIFNDGGLMKQVSMADIKVFTETGATPAESIKDLSGNNDPAEVGINYFSANMTSTQTVVLPASAGMIAGQKVRIKAPSDCSNTVKVIINRAGSQLMDGALESISLESPFAAVELVYVSANAWRIF